MVKIRFSRGGRKNLTDFTIVATDHRRPRDSKFLEKLGKYNPRQEDNKIKDVKVEKIKDWISKGAHLSDSVRTVLVASGVKF